MNVGIGDGQAVPRHPAAESLAVDQVDPGKQQSELADADSGQVAAETKALAEFIDRDQVFAVSPGVIGKNHERNLRLIQISA